jgi:drug/metabolite transporter (DMT)-like permease
LQISEKSKIAAPVAGVKLSKADGLVLACVTIWAFNVPFIKFCLQYFEPLETSMLRFTIAGLFFAIYVKLKEGSLRVERRHLPLLLGAGLMGITLNQLTFVYALKNTSSSEVSLLMAATPTFAALFAFALGQERIKLNFWLSLPVAVMGVAFIVFSAPGAKLAGNLLGDMLALATAASWAAYTVMIKPLVSIYSSAKMSAYILLSGAIALLPLSLPQLHPERMANIPPHIWLILLGYCTLGAVVLTNILWYTGVRELGAPRTAFYAYLQPFLGVFAAFLILSESFVPLQIVGGVLIVISMIIYRGHFRRKKLPVDE